MNDNTSNESEEHRGRNSPPAILEHNENAAVGNEGCANQSGNLESNN